MFVDRLFTLGFIDGASTLAGLVPVIVWVLGSVHTEQLRRRKLNIVTDIAKMGRLSIQKLAVCDVTFVFPIAICHCERTLLGRIFLAPETSTRTIVIACSWITTMYVVAVRFLLNFYSLSYLITSFLSNQIQRNFTCFASFCVISRNYIIQKTLEGILCANGCSSH